MVSVMYGGTLTAVIRTIGGRVILMSKVKINYIII